jgi:hypothetical protein
MAALARTIYSAVTPELPEKRFRTPGDAERHLLSGFLRDAHESRPGDRSRWGPDRARSRGRLKGRQPKLTPRQQAELARMHGTGGYTIAELMEVFSIGRATVYRVLERTAASTGDRP